MNYIIAILIAVAVVSALVLYLCIRGGREKNDRMESQ